MDVRFYPSAGGNSIPGEPPNMDFAHCLGYYNFNKVRRSPPNPSFVTTLLPLRPRRALQLYWLPICSKISEMKTNEWCVLSFISWVVCICWPALSVRSCLIRASTSVAANFLVYDRLEVEQEAGVVLSSTVHGRCSGSSTAFSKITDGSLHQHIPLKQ